MVVVARPTLLIVCRQARTPPIAFVHREQPHHARVLPHSGDYRACRFRIAQFEIHHHGVVTRR
jgi:hypothetical protein